MTHKQIYEQVRPGTLLYTTIFGDVHEARFKLTEVHTNYTGERTYYTVLEDEHTKQTWVDRGCTNEWFLTEHEAIKHGIEQLEKRVNEWQKQITKLKKGL